jgi:hypothetical protein
MTAGFTVKSPEAKVGLRVHLERYRNREYKETPLIDQFEEISEIVAKAGYEGDKFRAQIRIIYDVMMRKE